METKEMTKIAAQNFVRNTKYIVWSKDESKNLQRKLAELGCKWVTPGQVVRNLEHPFLFVSDKLTITCAGKKDCDIFNERPHHITSVEDVLSIKIVAPKFDPKTLKPFDRVLVKESREECWQCDLFSHIIEENYFKYFHCIGGEWQYCIPFNDETKHIVGTDKDAPEFYKLG